MLVFVGLALCGASQSIVLLSRAAAAEMYPPERRARGMSFVLFAAVSGAIFGPLIFGPLFSDRGLTPHELALPWLGSSLFAVAGLLVSLGIRRDPKELSKAFSAAGRASDARRRAAPRDPPAAGRADRAHRCGHELRGHGRRHEPRRLHGRRAPPRARRRLHGDQRPHRRHVRPGPRRRRRGRPDGPRERDGDRAGGDGRLERRARLADRDPGHVAVALRARARLVPRATSLRRPSSSRSPRPPSAGGWSVSPT